jgi:cystathionine beta-synthase
MISRLEGLFVGGSSGSALSGTLQYLHSAQGKSIAEDPSANVVIILPDGVRNYMSKPWFLDVAQDASAEEMRAKIKNVLGRELNDARSVVERAEEQGKELEKGQGVRMETASQHAGEVVNGSGEGKKPNGVSVSASSKGGIADTLRRLSLTA